MDNTLNQDQLHRPLTGSSDLGTSGREPKVLRQLTEERDACGVGVIAHPQGIASHDLITKALSGLTCLEHRGGCSADQDSGDGAGVMTGIPWDLFQDWSQKEGITLPSPSHMGVAMVFLPQDGAARNKAKALFEQHLKEEGLKVIGWRVVPVNLEILGPQARENEPQIEQLLVESPHLSGVELERLLYLTRKKTHLDADRSGVDIYIVSFSTRQILYKGMVRSVILGDFYLDLKNPLYTSCYAIFHRRFSTNTMPRWSLAQPLRMLGHNGEINTLLGNLNWMRTREVEFTSPVWGDRLKELLPMTNRSASDSANLDNVFELMVLSGRTPMEALMILVPEAFHNQPALDDHQEIIDFYEYYAGIQEPWDGPALLVFSDGRYVGAALDRNGLRPARYSLTKDGYIVIASETGSILLDESEVIEKGRLGPGQMMAIDLENHQVLHNWEIKQQVASQYPYGEWLKAGTHDLDELPWDTHMNLDEATLIKSQTAFGYTSEDVDMVVQAMAETGKEPTFCMGDDIPLAVLSSKPHVLYDYFKQRFAQVTNPPIDPLREKLVMSLQIRLGDHPNLLDPQSRKTTQLRLPTPILSEAELSTLEHSLLQAREVSTLYPVGESLKEAIDQLCDRVDAAVREGAKVVVLTDRNITPEQTYIPPMVATGAVHYHLIRNKLRCETSIVVDTAQCWSTHHVACLVGYGASAVCPYLALETVRHWWSSDRTQGFMERGKLPKISMEQALNNYRHAIELGLLKILSKMGISLLSSYHGAQIFEAIGIGEDLLDLAFEGTVSRVGGLSLDELAQETLQFHAKAFPELDGKKLENRGFIQYRTGLEYHMNSPEMSKALHKAVRAVGAGSPTSGLDDQKSREPALTSGGENGKPNLEGYDHYQLYQNILQERPPCALRDLLEFRPDTQPIPLEDVEPVESIVKRFCTGGMSLGSLGREAHETLAIAMNRIGGKSNSGEGGEDSLRYTILNDVDGEGNSTSFAHLKGLQTGDTASSAIKQVASGRFGVTPEYLMNAKQIEIKMAQGAKPGEGGQLPGKKVSPYIAMLRRSKPGVPLISPPPHHDIYSIEDLAQLIFDLHQINPNAGVSVKLVAEVGIGTVACGVAKANADVIQISGHDGGTGASPLSSIKHAGVPWELGVTEVHRMLIENGLRDRVLLRADGGLKTGWDVLMAALLGAEEYGFGSIAMIAEGCIMARICHTNNCPVGVATQQERLRQKFTGVPGHVVNFFYFVAEEVRQLLARLGYRSLSDVIGRADLLQVRDVKLTKTNHIHVRSLIDDLPDTTGDRSWLDHGPVHSNGPVLDDEILADGEIKQAIEQQTQVSKTWEIVNTDRSVGARISGEIARRYGNSGFTGELKLSFTGNAGQSFGAFNLPGMHLHLTGDANDYVGKGMHGGEIVIVPATNATFDPSENVIVGNTCLYGATGGILFANGQAGERFAVRNSLGRAVIEGAGDHCCEYMTGGVVVVLGATGRNVGAGMTGGLAYILDEDEHFSEKINTEIVSIQRVTSSVGASSLRELIESHHSRTGSPKAKRILENWETYLPKFWQVVPPSEANSPEVTDNPVTDKVAVQA
ncbi:glutamate synthase-related protein [Roseofilum sp. BLCC_M154]|uniref:Glutamate synthase-related protein n=1 Tax=Roseofilum acuticapitatum BLCC-M154 TaxID=3022444 RepID=A0ABT7AV96_9CYAN|nr:glutamate synthase-related protein [Roseofilum acuticapitatum]MDJ1170816.1 glutamate synthase-related protein [Roseofilum acuticapitatum BLCC-M154]